MSTSSARVGWPAEPGGVSRGPDPAGRTARGWLSERPSGAKVCSLRLDAAHLVHTGLAPAWGRDEIQAYLGDCAVEIVATRPGTVPPPGPLPAAVGAWDEAIRFGHQELWESGAELGTTIALAAGDALWVLSRGAHTVEIESPGSEQPDTEPAPSRRARLWRLEPDRAWTVRVRTAPETPPIWTARWSPERPAETETAPATAADPGPRARPPLRAVEPASTPAPARLWSRLPPRHRRRLGRAAAGLALAGVLALAVLAVPAEIRGRAGLWIADVVSARYRLALTSRPPGARVFVDGEDTGETTPALLALNRGEHRIVLRFGENGEHGEHALTSQGGRGGRSALHAEVLGRLVVTNANPETELHARLDGRPIGRLPAYLDSVPVGRRRLSFQGRDVRPWIEEVEVVAERTTQLAAVPELVPENGVVVARAWRVGRQGLTELPGAAVWLDGRRVGWTPARLEVPRGVHTVRLRTRDERSPVQLLRVDGGGELFATAEFGRTPEPEVLVEAPRTAGRAEPPSVRVRLESGMPIRIRDVTLFSRRWGRDFTRRPLPLLDGPLGTYAEGPIPIEGLEPGGEVEFYLVVESDQGEEFYSELQRVRIRS